MAAKTKRSALVVQTSGKVSHILVVGPLGASQWIKKAKHFFADRFSYAVLVDGGFETFEVLRKRMPALRLLRASWIGDHDSGAVRPAEWLDEIVDLPRDKDVSDFDAAFAWIQKKMLRRQRRGRPSHIFHLVGFAGQRPDHEWCVQDALARTWSKKHAIFHYLERGCQIYFGAGQSVVGCVSFREFSQTVSVLSLTPRSQFSKFVNFKYTPKHGTLRRGTHGLSNELRNPDFTLSCKAGRVLFVLNERRA